MNQADILAQWWKRLTGKGGEMVVPKGLDPEDFDISGQIPDEEARREIEERIQQARQRLQAYQRVRRARGGF